ncbi:unnamed protein product, partial [Mesorhabditis belari]|uniref:Uncharacterized protein n=1 Tax=Mesorhabditis belari TaxID=2138241 RepID=A0AAF3EIH6_9BILA
MARHLASYLHVYESPLLPMGSTKQDKYDSRQRTASWLLVTHCVLTSGLALSTIVLATGTWRIIQTPTCYKDWIYLETNGFCYYFQLCRLDLTLTDSTGSGLVMNANGVCVKNRSVWIGLHQEHGQRWWTDGSPDVFIGADGPEYIHWTVECPC